MKNKDEIEQSDTSHDFTNEVEKPTADPRVTRPEPKQPDFSHKTMEMDKVREGVLEVMGNAEKALDGRPLLPICFFGALLTEDSKHGQIIPTYIDIHDGMSDDLRRALSNALLTLAENVAGSIGVEKRRAREIRHTMKQGKTRRRAK